MPNFDTPLGLRTTTGQAWNINVESTGAANGNLTLNSDALTGGNKRLEINDETGNVGIGTTPSQNTRLSVINDAIAVAARGDIVGLIGSSPNTGVSGFTNGGGFGVLGSSVSVPGGLAGSFIGDVRIIGNLIFDIAGFSLDSPLDPEHKSLNHASIGSSEMLNVYSGNATLDENGEAWVELPDWCEALNRDFRYQLTCIGGFASVYIAEEVSNNRFKIAGGKSGMKLSWQLTGVRQDPWAQAHPLVVEEEKPANEQGFYQHPELYGQPEENGIYFARYPKIMRQLKEAEQRLLANT